MEWEMRERTEMYKFGSKEYPDDYEAYDDLFTIKMFHGGEFDSGMSKYSGGKVDFFDCCDVDKMSMLEISSMIISCADDKAAAFDVWYKNPVDSLEHGIKQLATDMDVVEMTKMVPSTYIVEVFVVLVKPIMVENLPIPDTDVHEVPVIEIHDDPPQFTAEELIEMAENDRRLEDEIREAYGIPKTRADIEYEERNNKETEERNTKEPEESNSKQTEGRKRRQKSKGHKPKTPQKSSRRKVLVSSADFDDVEEGSWHDDTSNKDMSDNDADFSNYITENVPVYNEGEERVPLNETGAANGCENEPVNEEGRETDHVGGTENVPSNSPVREQVGSDEVNREPGHIPATEVDSDNGDFPDSDYGDSSDERMAVSSDDEDDPLYPEFNENVDMANPKFELGMLFSSAAILRQAVKTHAILERRPIKRQANMGSIVQFVCTKPCEWKIYANKCQRSDTYQVRRLQNLHTCQPTFYQSQISSEWIAWKYEEEIRMNVNWEAEAFQRKVVNDLRCDVNMTMCRRAFKIALKQIKGDHAEQFGQMWDYLNEVRRKMPGTTVALELEEKEADADVGRFKRCYIALGPVLRGFKGYCRPLIGLDGCHLKGPFGGQLLTAVGVDPNDGMYPIAWAVVDVENTDNWRWFLTLLKSDLNIENTGNWTFVSDKQKGLIAALDEQFPEAEHRFCVMHLYRNMWKDHKGIVYRDLLWKAARSTTNYFFDKNMNEVKKLNKKCYQWLMDKPKEQWSRCGFRTICKSDIFVNNHCEVFNSAIRKYRHLPIITMLKEIHKGVMTRIQSKREKMEKTKGNFCPNVYAKLQKSVEKAPAYKAHWSGGNTFSVTSGPGGFELVVDMFERKCVCRKWELSGIPCMHAVACYNDRGINPEEGVHPTFKKSMYNSLYSHLVEPINGKEFWIPTGYPAPLPPNVKPAPGRPTKKRSTKTDIPKDAEVLPRQKTSVRCGKCRAWGHNVKTCPEAKHDTNKEATGPEASEVPTQATDAGLEVPTAAVAGTDGDEGLFEVPLSAPNVLSSQVPIDTTTLPQWEDLMRESQPLRSSAPSSQTIVVNESQGGILRSASDAQPSGVADKGKRKKTGSTGNFSKQHRKKLLKPWRP